MESGELLKWANAQLFLRNRPPIDNFFKGWIDGSTYHAIMYNHRPDLINLDIVNKSPEEIFTEVFDIATNEFKIKPLFSRGNLVSGFAVLENITFISELYQYFKSPKRQAREAGGVCFLDIDSDSEHKLSKRLFVRKTLQERFDELNMADGVVFKSVEEIQINLTRDIPTPEGVTSGDDTGTSSSKLDEDSNNNPHDDVDDDSSDASGNPFGDDDDDDDHGEDCISDGSESDISGNPFGDVDTEDEDQTSLPPTPKPRLRIRPESTEAPGNPFGSEEEEEEEEESKTNPFSQKPPPPRPPPPKIPSPKKKVMAPLPPSNISPFVPGRPVRPPPPKPKGKAPGFGNPVVKRTVETKEEEIRNELEEIDSEMTKLEKQGQKLEDLLRFNSKSGTWEVDDEDLVKEWISVVNKRNELGVKDAELGYRLRQNRLEQKHAELEFEMRKILNKPGERTKEDDELENRLMDEIVEVVNKKDSIGQLIDNCVNKVDDRPQLPPPKIPSAKPKVKKTGTIKMIKKVLVKKKKDKPVK